MSDHWTDRLSEYLDGEVQGAEREALEAHLEHCAKCNNTLEGLRQVVKWAEDFPGRKPRTDAWQAIAGALPPVAGGVRRQEIVSGTSFRRIVFTLPQLLAAGIALMLVSGTTVWWAVRTVNPAGESPPQSSASLLAEMSSYRSPLTVSVVDRVEADYAEAIADLEKLLARGRDRLDSSTARVIDENLRTIDDAIEEARLALLRDPAASYLGELISQNMGRKLQLLRDAAALVTART